MTGMSDERVAVRVSDGIADVTLNRPDKLNALDREMFTALADTAAGLAGRRDVRAVVLSGSGRAFCAGIDLATLGADAATGHGSLEERTHGIANLFQQAAWGWRELPVPVIAGIHGVAFGGGLQIALGADIRIIAPDARLAVMEARWGLVPDMGGIALLRGLVRDDVARELTYTARQVSGTEAVELGLATRTAEDPRAAARELVVYLAFHREGVRHGEWSLALWPDRPVSAATVHSTASDARRALGRAADGTLRLPCGPPLRLHPSVVTDVDRFAELARSGTCESWVEAAGMVRGPLFGGLRRADWAVLDGTHAHVEALVMHVLLQATESLRRDGLAAEAEWVVRRALLASPYDERLYRALLLALAAQGNRTRMGAAMAQLLVVARGARTGFGERKTGGTDALHPRTTELYRELLCSWPAPGGAPARL